MCVCVCACECVRVCVCVCAYVSACMCVCVFDRAEESCQNCLRKALSSVGKSKILPQFSFIIIS